MALQTPEQDLSICFFFVGAENQERVCDESGLPQILLTWRGLMKHPPVLLREAILGIMPSINTSHFVKSSMMLLFLYKNEKYHCISDSSGKWHLLLWILEFLDFGVSGFNSFFFPERPVSHFRNRHFLRRP